jgi:urease accessory protein
VTMWFAAGTALGTARSDALLEAARAIARGHGLAAATGATAPQDGVIVVRALAERVEPAMDLLQRIWRAWRPLAWGLAATIPRVWST